LSKLATSDRPQDIELEAEKYSDILCFRIGEKTWKISIIPMVYPINLIGTQYNVFYFKLIQKQRELYKIKQIVVENKYVYFQGDVRRYMAQSNFKVIIGKEFLYSHGCLHYASPCDSKSFEIITDGDFSSRNGGQGRNFRPYINQDRYNKKSDLSTQINPKMIYVILRKKGLIDDMCFSVLEFLYHY